MKNKIVSVSVVVAYYLPFFLRRLFRITENIKEIRVKMKIVIEPNMINPIHIST